MPLTKSKSAKAFIHNLKAEEHAGKPRAQALAIAYSVKRKAKKMADGGQVESDLNEVGAPSTEGTSNFMDFIDDHPEYRKATPPPDVQQWKKEHENYKDYYKAPANVAMEAEGGMIDKIMKKRRMYSKGGEVANDTPPIADEMPADYDDLALHDDLEFHETAANSGDELGDAAESKERLDIIDKVMGSWKKKDKLPRPA